MNALPDIHVNNNKNQQQIILIQANNDKLIVSVADGDYGGHNYIRTTLNFTNFVQSQVIFLQIFWDVQLKSRQQNQKGFLRSRAVKGWGMGERESGLG